MASFPDNSEHRGSTTGSGRSSSVGCLPLVALALIAMLASETSAQMFGRRTLGRTLSRRVGASAGEGAGTLTGRERFIRGNRSRTDFVGTDARDERPFVGRMQGRTRGNIRSGMTGFRIEEGPDVNRSAPRAAGPRIPVYPPRLQLGFRPPPPDQRAQRAARHVEEALTLARLGRIEVWMEGETAILRGEVASAHDAELAELLARFEPGVADVRNELKVGSTETRGQAPAGPRRS